MQSRCGLKWQANVYKKPEVLQFIDSYKFENPSEAPAESEPAMRYRDFLGRCYLDGGMNLVRNILNRFEGEFLGPKYPRALEKRIPHFANLNQNSGFW